MKKQLENGRTADDVIVDMKFSVIKEVRANWLETAYHYMKDAESIYRYLEFLRQLQIQLSMIVTHLLTVYNTLLSLNIVSMIMSILHLAS